MNRLYKYWIYYIKNDNDTPPELYAYTDDKSLAKEFELSRDMYKFIKVKKELSTEEVNYLASSSFKSNILHSYVINTKDKIDNIYKSNNVNMVMTELEHLTITKEESKFLLVDLGVIQYNLEDDFTKIKKPLKYNIYKALCELSLLNLEFDYHTDIEIDELMIFIKYYGKSIK